ncbi:MAG TPA: RDD family protein, partial [Aquabacterium sp.]|nr:RDD family protein [Aquabacterium sp.]
SFLNMERGYWSFDVIESLLGFVLFMAINGHLLRTQGQTVGKMLLKIRVVRTDGSRASLMTLAGVRYGVGYLLNVVLAVGMIYGLIDSLSIFRDSRRCIHDLIADTMVVKA